MLLVERTLDREHVHDRKDLGALEILGLDLAVIWKQADDVGVAAERLGNMRGDDRIDAALRLAVLEQLVERAAAAVLDEVDLLQERQHRRLAMRAGMLHRALDPVDLRKIDAVFMLQHAADPDRGGLDIERHADAPAL